MEVSHLETGGFMKIIGLFLPTLFALSAGAVSGPLTVTKDSLRIQRDDGFKVHFYKGTYPAELVFKDNRLYLSITRKDIRTDATLVIPAGQGLPENGSFNIDGTKTGQTFSVQGLVNTTKNRSADFIENETCSYDREEYVCRGRGRRRECGWELVRYTGQREVEFHFVDTDRELKADLLSNNGGQAEFSARESWRQKNYTYVGACN